MKIDAGISLLARALRSITRVLMKWQALKYKNEFLFFCEEIDFCPKQHAATKHRFLLDFKSFQESFSKLARLDTTARSMESKKKSVLFKESLCIVNRIKGDGESHLSLSNVSPGHSCVAPTGEKGFHIHCSLRNPKPTVGIFSIKQSTDMMSIQQQRSNPHRCIPHCSLACSLKPCSTKGKAGSL